MSNECAETTGQGLGIVEKDCFKGLRGGPLWQTPKVDGGWEGGMGLCSRYTHEFRKKKRELRNVLEKKGDELLSKKMCRYKTSPR